MVMLLLLSHCGNAWDSQLTEKLLGSKNREAAAAAEAAGQQNWTEVGVGIDPSGQPYVQQIARGKANKEIRAGLLLVATSQVQGDVFDQSVILVIQHDENGTLGLILNKPAPLPPDEHMEISEVLEEAFGVSPRNPRATEHLLAGGPVGGPGQFMYLHGGAPEGTRKRCYTDSGSGVKFVGSNGEQIEPAHNTLPPAGELVLEGVHFQSSGAFLKCCLRDPDGPNFRAFLGHSGWGAQQLDGEWRRGAWILCDASAEAVFTSDIGRLWKDMSSGLLGVRLCSRVAHAQSEDVWSEQKTQQIGPVPTEV